MADQRDKIQSIVRMKGPLLPNVIGKELGIDLLIASAMLSELVDSKVLRLSALKVGGSPVYFFANQEHRLQEFAKYLPEKERRAYDLLRQQVVLRDSTQEPLIRACLRQIRDFAVPLTANYGGKQELFWKWYLTPNSQAEELIKRALGIAEPRPIPPTKLAVPQERESQRREVQRSLEQVKPEAGRKVEREQRPAPESEPADKFYRKIKKYFEDNGIAMLRHAVIRKDADIEFVVEIPSAVGKLQYFCKAKNKKKITEGELSSAYLQGQKRQLPILFLTTGEIGKKAAQRAAAEFKTMSIKQI